MVSREISTQKYIISFVITLIIFSISFLIGLRMDSQRIFWLETQVSKITEFNNDLGTIIQTGIPITHCRNISLEIQKFNENILEIRKTYRAFKSMADLNARTYFNFETLLNNAVFENYLLAANVENMCNLNKVNILLIREDYCLDCEKQEAALKNIYMKFQGNVGLYVINPKKINPNALNYFGNVNMNGEALLVIINNSIFQGSLEYEKILEIVCQEDEELC